MATQIQQNPSRQGSVTSIREKDAEAVAHIEGYENVSQEDAEFLHNFGDERRKKLLWKVCNDISEILESFSA